MKNTLLLLAGWGLLLPVAGLAQTANYGYSGGYQYYTVPAGATSIQVVVVGASSGSVGTNGTVNAIAGAQVTATIPVTPGEQLTVVVGGQPSGQAGGYNGGGYPGYGSGGGGGTDVRRPFANGSTGDVFGFRNALVVAGGGGGSQFAAYGQGGAGGLPNGSNGANNGCATGGYGGSQSYGGSGSYNGGAGYGGSGGYYNGVSSSGAGGGYYGGGSGFISDCGFFGGGLHAGGSGGGSSWTTGSATGVSYVAAAIGNGSVSITATPPGITSFTPNPGGLGQAVTLTGTNLSGVTSLLVNGVDATASIANNTATSLTFRVPVSAPATGTTTLTTATGFATSTAFTLMAPPGNALAFDGANDYVNFGSPAALSNLGLAPLTMEAWVYCTNLPAVNSIIRKSGDYNLVLLPGGLLYAEVWSGGTGSAVRPYAQTTTAVPVNRWAHVAATWNGTALKLYLNGVDITGTTGSSPVTTSETLQIGHSGVYSQPFNGRLDEVRLYTAALTAAQIQADMGSTASAVPASLKFYLNFDQGTGGGNNSGLTTLYDLANAYPGTLTNFALTGTTSNYVESYALVVPTATAASSVGSTSFVANWTAPATGTVDNGYRLDVSTSSTFASAIAGSPFTVGSGTSRAITGLAASTTYYYRVRADKTSVTGQGDNSNVITVATCAAPVATAQNATLTLDASGNATLAATAVNNGSTANCGPAAAGALSVDRTSFSCTDVTPTAANAALAFNGSTQYVEGTNASLPLGNAARTLEAWVYPTVANTSGAVFNYGTPSTNLRAGVLLINGKLYYVGENNDLSGNIALTVNAWNHVAATYDGSTLKLYVNGVLDVQSNPGAFNTTGTTWRIAQRSAPQTGEFLAGRVDEVRVWNSARTAAQVKAAMSASLPGSTAGLVACYRLNEGSGPTVADASASNSPGTLYGAPTWVSPGAPVTYGIPVTLTVTDNSANTSTATAIVTVSVPATPTTTWNGGSTNWTSCANWSYGKVPDATTSVVIPTGRPTYPSLPAGTYPVLDLTIDNGGTLTQAAGATLQVNGNFANSGTATLSGTVAFVGSAATQTLGGSTSTPFTTLTVNKASGTVQLAQNLTLNSALTLTSGTLTTTASYQVNLGGSASISESDASYVLGKVVVNRPLSAGTTEPFAGLGLTLTPAAASTAPGATLVTRSTGTAIAGAGTSQSILRSFNIVPTVNTGLNVTMNFAYLDHERNGIAVASLALFKSVSGGTPWIPQRGTTAAGNVLTKTGISDFSVWTLGNSANPLPVELVAFTATAEGPAAVRLNWATASEKNSDRFAVERSGDGTSFAPIGTVAAAGSSSGGSAYLLLDGHLPAGAALLYYRLKQVDRDGTFAYSPVRSVALGGKATDTGLALFPNPAHGGAATLTGAVPGTVVTVFDALGRRVTSAPADAAGTAALVLPAGQATGVYVVRVGSKALRLTVE
ncbi:MAG: glycine-rich protein [Bacteroidota bacterium]|nr:glycine-rich protein [Bacteroidota bacterium]